MDKKIYDYIINNLIIITILIGIGIICINQAMPKTNYCNNIANSKLNNINSSYSITYCYPDTKDYYQIK